MSPIDHPYQPMNHHDQEEQCAQCGASKASEKDHRWTVEISDGQFAGGIGQLPDEYKDHE